jgi:ecdysteroid 22-hydroxylase
MDKYLRWGLIVRETMVPGTDVIWLFDPNDIATVLNDSTPGNYPRYVTVK